MKTEIICFSATGMETALAIAAGLGQEANCTLWVKSKYAKKDSRFEIVQEKLPEWTAGHWGKELLVFVGAIGIAVRAIASSVASKTSDPAVVVLDEKASFCIPLLSGHLGGANAFALRIAEITRSIPVVTTATDVNHRFAVDVFAKNNDLIIDSMMLAKEISAALLAKQDIGVYSELTIEEDTLPRGLCLVQNRTEAAGYPLGIYIGVHVPEGWFQHTLHLIPKILCLGMGCKRDTETVRTVELLEKVFAENQLDKRAISSLNSIDIKKEEKALTELSGELGVPFICYSAEELQKTKGDFTPAAFVRGVTGVDNVCERSAVLASGGGQLLVKKTAQSGVTAAVAMMNRRIHFE